MRESHGAEAVGHPGLFRGFPINTAQDHKRKEARCKPEFSHSRQHNLHHHVSVREVPSSKKVIHITTGCVIRDSVLQIRFIK